MPLPYDKNDVYYTFPLNYQDVDTSNSQFEVDIPFLDFLYYQQKQKRTNVVDGWGRLTLPTNKSFDVLRVKSEVLVRDSIAIDTFINFDFASDRPREVSYKWLAKNLSVPVLEIIGTSTALGFTPTSIKYLHTEAPAPDAVAHFMAVPLKIVHQNKMVYIINNANLNIKQIQVLSQQGQLMQQVVTNNNNSELHMELPSLANGIYYYKIFTDGKTYTFTIAVN
jgi:hypothetical protein